MPGAGAEGGGAELRRTPRVGDRVHIVHLAAWEEGTVLEVHDGGRRLEVRGEEQGVTHEFVLNRATARFVAGGSHGPRLRWPRTQARPAEPDERG
ncbi:MAG TPA: hypothetical protein VGL54_04815 [Solirubrobacteraceae bacterium]